MTVNRSRALGAFALIFLMGSVFLSGMARGAPAAMFQAEGLVTPEPTPAAVPGDSLPGNPTIQLVQVAGGLVDPINIANAGDGSGRLFPVERVGRIRIIDGEGNLLDEPFLDIQEAVKTAFLEQGLLGVAFHPNYAENGRIYVYYADYTTNGNPSTPSWPMIRIRPIQKARSSF